jgi:hypothetical protein
LQMRISKWMTPFRGDYILLESNARGMRFLFLYAGLLRHHMKSRKSFSFFLRITTY